MRHSGARHVRVALEGRPRSLLLEVVDDGHGGVRDRDGGVGMESMRQRAVELGGRFGVESGAAGTRVVVSLPLA
uniref:hypothetical protein n=1 Tax=Tessaracoccus coleopterorum TaxID=2714950 RepID=UPI0038CD88E8